MGGFANAAVLGRVWLSPDCFELTTSRPPGLRFEAGQHVTLRLAEAEREYTIVSSPSENQLRFLVKRVARGRMSTALAEMAVGEELQIDRVKGYLVPRPSGLPRVLVATGTGIAPFVSMAAAGLRGFILLQGARTPAGLYYRQQLEIAARNYVPCITGGREASGEPLPYFYGRVCEYLERELRRDTYDFYVCGSWAVIRNVTLLLDQAFPDSRVFSEAYS